MWLNFKYLISLLLIILSVLQTNAQDPKLLTDKSGTFKIDKSKLNGQGPDSYDKSCGFADAEANATAKNLIALLEIFRRIPVLSEIKGFDGIYDLYGGGRCNTKYGYGLPTPVYFFFKTWDLRKGKIDQWTIEPPVWFFEVDMTDRFCSNGFNVSNFQNEYRPTNEAYTAPGMNKAAVELRELFYLPGKKEVVSPGIDRYGDNLILFNPDRPAYWSQVTIREVFRLLMDYWKLVPDKSQVEAMMPILENEFSSFTESEKDGFAYVGRPETISRIGSEKKETPVMRPNPDYWNRKLPRSAIQFMWLEIPPKEIVKSQMDERWKRQDGYYYVSRLLYELDVKTLLPSIEK